MAKLTDAERKTLENDFDPTDADAGMDAYCDLLKLYQALGVRNQMDAVQAIRGLQERVKFTQGYDELLAEKTAHDALYEQWKNDPDRLRMLHDLELTDS